MTLIIHYMLKFQEMGPWFNADKTHLHLFYRRQSHSYILIVSGFLMLLRIRHIWHFLVYKASPRVRHCMQLLHPKKDVIWDIYIFQKTKTAFGLHMMFQLILFFFYEIKTVIKGFMKITSFLLSPGRCHKFDGSGENVFI